ncbi:NadR/Ttd14 AAA domain-containing protein [Entamoeba marina]
MENLVDNPLECLDGEKPKIFRIVLTGGPGGGKTTSLSLIADQFRPLGVQVFHIQENSTMFFNSGAGFPIKASEEQRLCWEICKIRCQIAMEEQFHKYAQSTNKKITLILSDRGTMDSAAYTTDENWEKIMKEADFNYDYLCNSRYDLVLHLRTTAIGALRFYDKKSNPARRENPDEAANLDYLIEEKWERHPHQYIIDNSTDFPNKIRRICEKIADFCGFEYRSVLEIPLSPPLPLVFQ